MLVDNAVEGDSRVQKEARSIVERGWDVVLLGKAPDGTAGSRWKLGKARVRLLPVPLVNARRPHEFRRAPLRAPLAYPDGNLPALQKRRADAGRVDAQTRRAVLAHRSARGELSAPARLLGASWALAHRAWAKAYSEWVDLRIEQTEAMRERRRAMQSPLDRATTATWQRLLGNRSWRHLDPNLWSYELAYGPVIDALKPDLIHANDFRMLGVGARAVLRARMGGRDAKLVWDSHDFLPGINPWNPHPRWHPAQIAHEREFAPYADGIVTVSETMVRLLSEHHRLQRPPVIVRNAPTIGLEGEGAVVGVREVCGLADDVPLLVYVGVMTEARGVDLIVDALPDLPGVHAVFVARTGPHLDRVLGLAERLGVGDRVHVAPYVAVDDICRYIASANIGVWPGKHLPNHEVDLPTKFYEYAQARLPMVVSDLETVAETTRRYGQGEVFVAEDRADYLRAVRAVLEEPERYRASYDRAEPWSDWLWEKQADILDALYAELLDART